MKRLLTVLLLLAALAGATVVWLGLRHDPATPATAGTIPGAPVDPAALIERGRYLALAGDCKACHTERGGAEYAGGRGIPTPFGTFYSPNLTPDRETGLGDWTADDFWLALHEGRSRDGKLLYPAFPYTNYTKVTRADSDALYAYLRSLPPVQAPVREHELVFPYQYRLLLVGWRGLFFRPGVYEPDPARDADWNRGAYLVQGLGHCSACHEARNAVGAIQSADNPSGGLVLSWYAPSLRATAEASVAEWTEADVVALLGSGINAHASTVGPMAEVVYESLQHLVPDDLRAMSVYLRSLPPTAVPEQPAYTRVPVNAVRGMAEAGATLYREHCADCHGDAGEGRGAAGLALAGNRALTMESAVNNIRVLRFGGYPPGTPGNPRPYGMPPFGTRLSDEQIAEVLTYVRTSWGNNGRAVSAEEVRANRHLDR